MDNVVMIVKGKTISGKRSELRQAFERILAPRARENSNQPLVLFCEDTSDADAFVLIEAYTGMAAMQSNAQAPWFQEYMSATLPLLASPPEVVMGTPRWAKGAPF